MNVGITGVEGLIGFHLRAFLKSGLLLSVIPATRATFKTCELLNEFVRQTDIIVHLAGMNRGTDEEIYNTNLQLAQKLIESCESQKKTPYIIFASSTHIFRETMYGQSKKKCAELFQTWADRNGAKFTCLILPHVFGEGGRPFYNSVISTFCYQVANNERPQVQNDSILELVHTQRVAKKIHEIINQSEYGQISLAGEKIAVSEALEKILAMDSQYRSGIVPLFQNEFELSLFNTYRSYLFPKHYPLFPKLYTDNRGRLFEAVKSLNCGQAFISTTKPEITRGNHYHLRKFERFCVIAGTALIKLRRLFQSEIIEFYVTGDKPSFIDIPTFHTHFITNIGSAELTTLFWSHEFFDPNNSDTYVEKV